MKEELFVVAVTGTIAAGKGAASDYFKKLGFKKITSSDYLRREAEIRGISCSRENLRKIQAWLRKEYGEDYLVSKIIETILTKDHLKNSRVVIEGLRTPFDVKLAKKRLNAKIIFLDAKPEIRFLRQKARGRIGFKKTYPEFLEEEAIEQANFDFHITRKMSDFFIENNGGKEELYKKLKVIVKKLKL